MEFNPEYIKFTTLINEVVKLLNDSAQQKSIIISSEIPPDATVFADKDMLSTIMRNLISNALKFTNFGGEIVILATQKQDEMMVAVCDNGVGIKKEIIEKLFRIEASTSTMGTQKEPGTGLGLLLCKEFVEKHGGKIWAESETGKGSTFYFTIPIGVDGYKNA
jgi:signal transduction histidine kinase